METNKKYFMFPLPLLRMLWSGEGSNFEQAMNILVSYSIVIFAKKQKVEETDAARQAVYNYYRGGGMDSLQTQIAGYFECGKITIDDSESGFNGNTFTADDNINEVLELFKQDSEFKNTAILNCQLSKIEGVLGITGGSPKSRMIGYTEAKRYLDWQTKKDWTDGGQPLVSIETGIMFDLRDQNKKTLFAMYAAIRSIEGNQRYIFATKDFILLRMFGIKSTNIEGIQRTKPQGTRAKILQYLNNRDTRAAKEYGNIISTEKKYRTFMDKHLRQLQGRGLLKTKFYHLPVTGRRNVFSTKNTLEYVVQKIKEKKQKPEDQNNKAKELFNK